jgi:predicted phosphodiesterase
MGGLMLPWQGKSTREGSTTRFGIIADVHKDIIHDADRRLSEFIDHMKDEDVDFILQMGDFCHPIAENQDFMNIWEGFEGNRYHVLGNHDMDLGSKQDAMQFWGMSKNYYSFDRNGMHFVVLDANYIKKTGSKEFVDYDKANFYISYDERPFINDEQMDWLEGDLKSTANPTFIFSHQSLENEKWGVVNNKEVLELLAKINDEAGWKKVVACFNGHHHVDYYYQHKGIHLIMINSASYFWVGEKYMHKRFSKKVEKKHPHLSKVIPYEDPIYALVTIMPEGKLLIEGSSTDFIEPGPEELNYPSQEDWNRISPKISDLKANF